jgi:hypothetical protein
MKPIVIALSLGLFCIPLTAKEVHAADKGYYLDLPAGWEDLDTRDTAAMSYVDPGHTTIFQLFCFPAEYFGNADEMLAFIRLHLNAKGEGASFTYSGTEAYLADLTFSTKSYDVRGYFVFINGTKNDYVLMCFTQVGEYLKMHDFLLSSLDSFAPDTGNRLLPGPISQFYYQFPGSQQIGAAIPFEDTVISFSYDKNEIEATEVVINREARILAAYPTVNNQAWARFYRVIYRDNYARFKDFSAKLFEYLNSVAHDNVTQASLVLAWIQSFIYRKHDNITDFSPPLAALLDHAGDCDSRAVLFLILLKQMKFDAVLFLSSRFKHCAVGIALNASGAKLMFEGKAYVFAELTATVALGMIAKEMADPSGWLIIRPEY